VNSASVLDCLARLPWAGSATGGSATSWRLPKRDIAPTRRHRRCQKVRIRWRAALGGVFVAALVAGSTAAGALAADAPNGDVVIPMDEREIRAAGIATTAVDKERGEIELSLPGTVVIPPQHLRVVAAPANGLVESMLVAADEPVKAGQPIARLRSPDLVEAQRQFLAALADEALAADRLRRSQMLFEARATPERELRVAQTESTHAKSLLDERQQILRLMELSDADIQTLRATRKIFPAVTVHAPISGTVVTRHVSPGERVAAAAPIFTIAELDPLWVNIQVPASRLATIKTGETVSLPAYGVEGRIIRVGRTVEPQTQSAIAVAEIDPKAGSVRPGLAVSVTIRLAQGAGPQWSVPAAAVVRHRDRAWVFLRSSEGFRARPVQVVTESPGRASIRTEVSPQDQVADRGILALLAELAAADKD
jgi:cobalt-zinc-cadmium efflux system membrane fusion protein